MSKKIIPYSYAKVLANRIIDILEPHCERINIAGSVLREENNIGDIDIVCTPKRQILIKDMFGEGKEEISISFIDQLKSITEKYIKGDPSGRYTQVILIGGYELCVFTPQETDYYRQLAIRTGPSNYAHNVIASKWSELGWCGTKKGLRKKCDCYAETSPDGKVKNWRIVNEDGEIPPYWGNEVEFFKWLGIEYIIPKLRR